MAFAVLSREQDFAGGFMNKILFIAALLLFPTICFGANPTLFFSDLHQGNRTGLTDANVTNQGVIVTIWGTSLGSSQGASKVYVGSAGSGWTETAYVYCWQNATGSKPGGPADLYSRHKMQEIAFAIASSTATGNQKIKVTVGGVDSNQLDFEVKTSGSFKFINRSSNPVLGNVGNDTAGNGSWATPWATVQKGVDSTNAGDVIYVLDKTETGSNIVTLNNQGTSTAYKGIVAYPNSLVTLDGQAGRAIKSYCSSINADAGYWVISKVLLKSDSESHSFGPYERFIGNAVTESDIFNSMQGMLGSGAQYNDIGGWKIYGNYIYNVGTRVTSNNQSHVFYFTHRYWTSYPVAMRAFDLGWNYLKNNWARFGIHFYDEGNGQGGSSSGQYETGTLIHDNVVEDQDGYGIGFNAGGSITQFTLNTVYVYNNVLIECGRNRGSRAGGNYQSAIFFSYDVSMTAHIYNNTIYGYAFGGDSNSSALSLNNNSASTIHWKNNIVVDTNNKNYVYAYGSYTLPASHTNNLWYNGGDGNPASPPTWDTSPVTSDPLFVNPTAIDFRLQLNSPAKNAGTDSVSSVVSRDLDGVERTRYAPYDIGAYEYTGNYPAAPRNLRIP